MDPYVRPNPTRAALLTIDVQRDFTLPDAPATIPGTVEAVPQMARLTEAFRRWDAPVVHVVRLYRSDGSNVDACRRASVEGGESVVRPGSAGAEIVADLVPDDAPSLDADRLLDGAFQELGANEWATYKPRWSAFHDTGLDAFLRDRGVDTVVVCGCNFPNCPRTTVYDASSRDFRIVFVPDATSGTYERGLDEFDGIGVAVLETDETVGWLDGNGLSDDRRP